MKLRVYNIIKKTKIEGPGTRYCIWVQGCSRHCKGCQAVHTWPHDKGDLYYVEDIIKDIYKCMHPSPAGNECSDQDLKATYVVSQGAREAILSVPTNPEFLLNDAKGNFIEGVTFLGGEPFEQAEALGIIAEEVQKFGLSVVCFTGGKIEELRLESKNKKLLDNTDLLIDGEFVQELTDYSRPWCGSSNQRYHFFTDRYNEEIFTKYKNKVEININKNGQIFINGMGNFDEILQKVDLIGIQK